MNSLFMMCISHVSEEPVNVCENVRVDKTRYYAGLCALVHSTVDPGDHVQLWRPSC